MENRLQQVTYGANTSAYTYDGDGRRMKKVEEGTTTHFPVQYLERNVTSGQTQSHYYFGGKYVATRFAQPGYSDVTYLHQEHLESTKVRTDSNGGTDGDRRYEPYGGVRTQTGTIGVGRLFTGQRLDGTELYYYNARYYDPGIGRFVSADTVVPNPANPQSLNRYSYVLNNPLRYTDPTGHFTQSQIDAANDIVRCGSSCEISDGNFDWALDVLDPGRQIQTDGTPPPVPGPSGGQTSAAAVQNAAPVQAGGTPLAGSGVGQQTPSNAPQPGITQPRRGDFAAAGILIGGGALFAFLGGVTIAAGSKEIAEGGLTAHPAEVVHGAQGIGLGSLMIMTGLSNIGGGLFLLGRGLGKLPGRLFE